VNGAVDFESQSGQVSTSFSTTHSHVRIYVQAKGHGPIPCRAQAIEPLLGYAGFGPGGVRCAGVGEPGFKDDTGIVLAPGAPVPFDNALTSGATASYALVNMESTLWRWRGLLGEGGLWRSETFDYVGVRGELAFELAGLPSQFESDQFLNDAVSGTAPWRVNRPGTNSGDLFFDPAAAWTEILDIDHPVDQSYSYNPYLYAEHATDTD
jgi:hypothetical protein